LVVDPPSEREEMAVPSAASKRRKASKKAPGGIEDWYVNTRNEEPGMDDT
jgi:hypothetical protein